MHNPRGLCSMVILLAGTLLLLHGCSSEGPDEPSGEQLSKVFASKNSPFGMPLPEKEAKCIADVYADSGLSAEYLDALAAGKAPAPAKEDREELDDLQAKIAEDCIGI